jgi:glycosyltransferase involved in cell wall biosynthesis
LEGNVSETTKPIIVISAVNLRSGGTLSILQDCLSFLQDSYLDKYQVIALVYDKKLLHGVEGIEFIEYAKPVRSYINRLFYEYVYFNKLSKKLKPYLWFSLHDMTPTVKAEVQAVYCHNPSLFYRLKFKQAIQDPKFALFNLFYKYLYKINIKKNDYVIVQQDWIRRIFKRWYEISSVVVAYPDIQLAPIESQNSKESYRFFFPTLPRFFKNIDIIIDAVKLLNKREAQKFEVVITINGQENRYARRIVDSAVDMPNIKFVGRISRDEVFSFYGKSDCLIFPSKLETWGLPITEFKQTKKPMLIADLPYANETVGNYEKVNFFHPDDANELADLMQEVMSDQPLFSGNKARKVREPFTQSWAELFKLLLNEKA